MPRGERRSLLLPGLAVALLLGVERGVGVAALLLVGLLLLLGLLGLLLLTGSLLSRIGRPGAGRAVGGLRVALSALLTTGRLASLRTGGGRRRLAVGLLAGVALERLLGRGLAGPGRAADGRLLRGRRAAEERVDASRTSASGVGVLAGGVADRRAAVRDGLVVASRREVAVGRLSLLSLDVGRRERGGRGPERGGRRGGTRRRLGVGWPAPLLLLPSSGVLVVVG